MNKKVKHIAGVILGVIVVILISAAFTLPTGEEYVKTQGEVETIQRYRSDAAAVIRADDGNLFEVDFSWGSLAMERCQYGVFTYTKADKHGDHQLLTVQEKTPKDSTCEKKSEDLEISHINDTYRNQWTCDFQGNCYISSVSTSNTKEKK